MVRGARCPWARRPWGGTAPSFTRLRAPPPLEDWRAAPRGFSVQPAGPLSMWRVSGRGPERSRAGGGRQARPPHGAVAERSATWTTVVKAVGSGAEALPAEEAHAWRQRPVVS